MKQETIEKIITYLIFAKSKLDRTTEAHEIARGEISELIVKLKEIGEKLWAIKKQDRN